MFKILKKFFDVNFFFSNILVPLAVLVVYCYSFSYISSYFLLNGVNQYFANKFGRYVLLITILAFFVFGVILAKSKSGEIKFRRSSENIRIGDAFLLLLPLTPIIQYILNNQDMLNSAGSLQVLIVFFFFSSFYIFFAPVILGNFMPSQGLIAVGLAFAFTIADMASISNQFSWFEKGTLRIQIIFFGVVFWATWLSYSFNAKQLLYFFVTLNLIVNSSAQLLSRPAADIGPSHSFGENALLSLVANKTPIVTPNIYLLLYDAYVPNETMSAYGIDNSPQEIYLTSQGFKLYPHTYSIGSVTVETMSKVLNASAEYYGNHRKGISGDGVTQQILKSIGYETYGLFGGDYMFRGYGNSYDYSYPSRETSPSVLLLKAIFLGEFRFDIEKIGLNESDSDEFFATRRDVFEDSHGEKVFVYTHVSLPGHSQNSGVCLPDEINLYKGRLENANIMMQQDIDLIIKNDPDAIVIVAGDHGPYLTKNCASLTDTYDISEVSRIDIQDRHATFLAIRWPTGDFVKYDDIVVLQDLFPSVFAYIYKDATILQAKIEPVITVPNRISGVSVNHGVIVGGIDDGQPLFLFPLVPKE